MSYRQYPKHNGTDEERGFTVNEIKKGIHTIFADYECPECNYIQPVPMGNICLKCGHKYE